MRLGLGGKARLAKLAKNQDVPISGKMIWVPRANKSVRLWIDPTLIKKHEILELSCYSY